MTSIPGLLSGLSLHDIDILLVVVGGLLLVLWAIRWWRKGRQDPLRGAPIRLNRLTPLWLWLCILAQLSAWIVGHSLVSMGHSTDPQPQANPQLLILGGNIAQALMLIFCLLVARMTFVTGSRGLGIGRRAVTADLLPAIAGWLAANAACSLVYWLSVTLYALLRPNPILPQHAVLTVLADPDSSPFVRMLAVAGAILLAPAAEELLFRGILQSGIKKLAFTHRGSYRHRWVAIIITAHIFGLMHTSTPHHIPALIALGIILGYLYERSGSLVLPILVHMLFNGKTLLWMALTR